MTSDNRIWRPLSVSPSLSEGPLTSDKSVSGLTVHETTFQPAEPLTDLDPLFGHCGRLRVAGFVKNKAGRIFSFESRFQAIHSLH
jgi:hypothetical protein